MSSTGSALHQLQVWTRMVDEADLDMSDRPMLMWGTVGVPGWLLPDIPIVDRYGLNDYVIARSPAPVRTRRMMAHERDAPSDYRACLKPNIRIQGPSPDVSLVGNRLVQGARLEPLTDEEIRACEHRAW
jgi:hypothetical protein